MQQINNNIIYIGVPFQSGANREGAQHAPKWLMEHMLVPEDACSVLQFPTEDAPLVDAEVNGVKNYQAVLQMIRAVKHIVSDAIANNNKVVTIGGDHSIAMGSIAGVLKHYPNTGVIWFDAHTDINTEDTTPSGCAHGMPLASLMGLCKSEINNDDVKINPKKVYWVGARDIDAGEWETIHRLGIESHVYTSEKVHQLGMNAVMAEIRNQLRESGVDQIHISFDIDGIDPLIVFATGTPVENGLTETDCDEFIKELAIDMPPMVSMDFVEYNPLMDDVSNTTGRKCTTYLEKLIKNLD